jgi:hypothetical protein
MRRPNEIELGDAASAKMLKTIRARPRGDLDIF